MKRILLTTALAFTGTMAFAQVDDPRADIFRLHGCDTEWLKPVVGADGVTILYWTNTSGQGCDADRGDPPARTKAVTPPDDGPDDEGPGDDGPGDDGPGDDGPGDDGPGDDNGPGTDDSNGPGSHEGSGDSNDSNDSNEDNDSDEDNDDDEGQHHGPKKHPKHKGR